MIYVHSKKQNITHAVIIGIVVAGAVFAYNYFSTNHARAQDPLTSDATTETPSDSPLSPDQAALLEKIKSIKLDGTIFKDSTFLSLYDFSVDLGHMEVGKPNPFSPVLLKTKAASKK